MRIGLFGNTNNYPMLLAQGLQALGHEAVLVLDSSERLHRPENRSPELAGRLPEWIIDGGRLSELDYIRLSPALAPVLEALAACDALILNSLGPSLLPLLDRPAVSFLTGSDLTYYANPRLIDVRTSTWNQAYADSLDGRMEERTLVDFLDRQRWGIRHSEAVSYLPMGIAADGDSLLNDLGIGADRRFCMLMAEVHRLPFSPPPHNRPLRVFCATRFTWKLPPEPGRSLLDYKASDVMIRGLGMYKRLRGRPLRLRLVRKGLHVREAEELVRAEGLAEDVQWLDEMTLEAVWEEFRRCDIGFEQMGPSMVGMAGMDAMVIGRPLIADGRPEVMTGVFGAPLPVCQARTPAEVCSWLERLEDAEERARLGAEAHRFACQRFEPQAAARECVRRLQGASEDRSRSRIVQRLASRQILIEGAREASLRAAGLEASLAETQARAQNLELYLQDVTAQLTVYKESPFFRLVRSLLGKRLRAFLSRAFASARRTAPVYRPSAEDSLPPMAGLGAGRSGPRG